VSGGTAAGARDGVDESFADFVTRRQGPLLRLAFLLTGDRGSAEDLVHAALSATYRRWDRISRHGDPTSYARRALVTAHTSWRRRIRPRERGAGFLPDAPGGSGGRDDGEQLRRALGALPPRMRATVVLRSFENLSVLQTAQVMGCSEHTVDLQAARGLARLRRSLSLGGMPEIRSEEQLR
jgi:RNA polymerase sigma-70 factor (sigma-E family)